MQKTNSSAERHLQDHQMPSTKDRRLAEQAGMRFKLSVNQPGLQGLSAQSLLSQFMTQTASEAVTV